MMQVMGGQGVSKEDNDYSFLERQELFRCQQALSFRNADGLERLKRFQTERALNQIVT